jgi:hypothetical protein
MKRLAFLLFTQLICFLSFSQSKPYDFRDRLNGKPIYVNGYIDQPYVVVLDSGEWLCVFTTGAGAEGTGGQHIVSSVSTDKGSTWSKPVRIERPASESELVEIIRQAVLNKQRVKVLAIASAAAIAFVLFMSTGETTYTTMVSNAIDEKVDGQTRSNPQYISYRNDRAELTFSEMSSDARTSALVLAAFALLVILVVRGTVKPQIAMSVFILLLVVDLLRRSERPQERRAITCGWNHSPTVPRSTATRRTSWPRSPSGVGRTSCTSRASTR